VPRPAEPRGGRPAGGWPEPYLQAEGLAECRRCGRRYRPDAGGWRGQCPDCRDVLRSDAARRMALSRAAKKR
jgi:hypothetical protein